jgi:hypothetical protein
VQAVSDKLYVTFADLLNPTGGGGGAVDVFDTNGSFKYQLDANGPGPQGRLQNPWGITQAPANFGAFSNDLLVGNVAGAGNINAYDPNTHQWLGQLHQPNGEPIAIKGLWDLEFGDGMPKSGKTNQLFFDAGPNHPGDSTGGLFGVIRAAGDQGDLTSIVSTSIVSSPTMPSSTMPTSSRSSPNSMPEQEVDAIFQKFGAVSLSPDTNLTAVHPQLSGFFAMPKWNLDALEAMVLDRLDALETAGLRMM